LRSIDWSDTILAVTVQAASSCNAKESSGKHGPFTTRLPPAHFSLRRLRSGARAGVTLALKNVSHGVISNPGALTAVAEGTGLKSDEQR